MIDIDVEPLHALGLTHTLAARAAQRSAPEPGLRLARVVETQRDRFTLHDGRAEHQAQARPRLLQQLQARPGSSTASSPSRRSRGAPTTDAASRWPATSMRRCW